MSKVRITPTPVLSSLSGNIMHRFILGPTLGEGAFGYVRVGVRTETNEQVAVKTLKDKCKSLDDVMALPEVKALQEVVHKHIVRCQEIIHGSDNKVHLVFELMPGGNLEQFARKLSKPLREHQVRTIFYQILQAMRHMHSSSYIHRDIKPENILLVSSSLKDPIHVKLADLGLSKFIDPSSRRPHTTYVSTRWYRSPELLLRFTDYGPSSDMWAVGAVMAELVSLGSPLFPGKDEQDQLTRSVALRGHPAAVGWKRGAVRMAENSMCLPKVTASGLAEYVRHASLPVLQLITDLLHMDPTRRPTAEEALLYPLFLSEISPSPAMIPSRKRGRIESDGSGTARTSQFPSSGMSSPCEAVDAGGQSVVRDSTKESLNTSKVEQRELKRSKVKGSSKHRKGGAAHIFNIPAFNEERLESSNKTDQVQAGMFFDLRSRFTDYPS